MDYLRVFFGDFFFIDVKIQSSEQLNNLRGESRMSRIEKKFVMAIKEGDHLIKVVEKINSHQALNIQSHRIYLTLVRAQILYLEALQRGYQNYRKEYQFLFGSEEISLEKLKGEIKTIEKLLRMYQRSLQKDKSAKNQPLKMRDQILFSITELKMKRTKVKQKRLARKIQTLAYFQATASKYLGDAEVVEALLKVGLKMVGKKHEADFTSHDLRWFHEVNQRWNHREFVKKYQIERLDVISDRVFERYVEKLKIHENILRIAEGWDQYAIFEYFKQINQRLRKIDTMQVVFEQLPIFKEETKRVGSMLYTKLFNASSYTDKEKVALVMKQLQASIDQNGMLQLKGPFQLDSEMPPHHLFLENFARSVIKAYPKGLIPKNNPDTPRATLKKIHQFRMYLDRQNIGYIRAHYFGLTDLDKLLAYGKKHRLSFNQTSRLHNRYSVNNPFKGQENDKITTKNGLSEFIVNVTTGKFMTQWDVLQEENGKIGIFSEGYQPNTLKGKELVETESFNYSDQAKEHQLFDVAPASAQQGLEHDAKIAAKKYWKSEAWSFQGGNYIESYKKKTDYPLLKKRRKNR